MTSEIVGFKELSKQLRKMGAAPSGKIVRRAALSAMLPALRAAQSAAPVGNPPYTVSSAGAGVGSAAAATGGATFRRVDPYPVRSYKGRLRTPGFTSRNIARKAVLHREGGVSVFLGVKPEAFYSIQFIEFGYGNNARRPWLEPAFRSSIPAVDARFRQRLKQIIDKAAK